MKFNYKPPKGAFIYLFIPEMEKMVSVTEVSKIYFLGKIYTKSLADESVDIVFQSTLKSDEIMAINYFIRF